jgi:hypothetical protein
VAQDRETLEKRVAWQKKMHAAGWVGISWPKEYGGRGASLMQQVIFDEEYFRARAPVLPPASALNLLGPTLIHWGNEEQKQSHLPRILSADELWCQGYSEPDAGGELASLRTRAVDRGDHFIINAVSSIDRLDTELSVDLRTKLEPPQDLVGFTLFIRDGYLSSFEGYTFGDVRWPDKLMEEWLIFDTA